MTDDELDRILAKIRDLTARVEDVHADLLKELVQAPVAEIGDEETEDVAIREGDQIFSGLPRIPKQILKE